MKVAIIGSRSLRMPVPEDAVPKNATLILSGAANGVDRSARAFALAHHIPIHEVLPDYARYGRSAPLRRNDAIIDAADYVVALWDGKSSGTAYVIERCRRLGKPLRVLRVRVQTGEKR